MQDAYDLAWKLAMVVQGHADATLLETYDAQRVPIGQALLASTAEVMDTTMVDTGSADAHEADSAFARTLTRNMSGLMIEHPRSPLTVTGEGSDEKPGDGPRPGQRPTRVGAADAQSPGWTALRARLRTPAWRLLVFARIVLDVLSGITSISGVPHDITWPIRLGGHVFAGTWITSSVFTTRRSMRVVGVITGVWLAGCSFVADVAPVQVLHPTSLLIVVRLALPAWRYDPVERRSAPSLPSPPRSDGSARLARQG